MKSLRLFFAVILVCAAARAAAPVFQAGAAMENITPTNLPSPINGGMRGAFSSAVTDPMHARSVALHDGRSELILCVVDACMIPREVCEATKGIAA